MEGRPVKKKKNSILSYYEFDPKTLLGNAMVPPSITSREIYTMIGMERNQLRRMGYSGQNLEILEAYVLLIGILILQFHNEVYPSTKYYKVTDFLLAYPENQEVFCEEDPIELMHFANAVHYLLQFMSPLGYKYKMIIIAACLTEGPNHRKYTMGGSPSKKTYCRVLIYHHETGVADEEGKRGKSKSIYILYIYIYKLISIIIIIIVKRKRGSESSLVDSEFSNGDISDNSSHSSPSI